MTLTEITRKLDRWVSVHGSGRYFPVDHPSRAIVSTDFTVPEDFGCQQVREEVLAFAEVLLKEPSRKTALEVGLGYFGSTHYLWRQLYTTVGSVELQWDRIMEYGSSTREYGEPCTKEDVFFLGKSSDASTVSKVYSHFPDGVDMLFIDGGHTFGEVLSDYLLYAPLVRQGGIVAFHDAIASQTDVPKFMKWLKADLNLIVHSKDFGIAWYRK